MTRRRTISLIFALLLVATLPVVTSAQSFSVASESASATGDVNGFISGYIQVTNLTGGTLNLRVAITNKANLPGDWGTQICFFQNCFPPSVESVDGTLGAGESEMLDLTFMTGPNPGTGTVQVTVSNRDNPNESRVLTFTATSQVTSSYPAPTAGSFFLAQNYPNPFSMSKTSVTNINYVLPSAGYVSLKIYNLLGKEVRTLVNESRSAGKSTAMWDGRDNHGKQLPTGVYVYKLSANGQNFSRRMSFTR